MTAAYRDLSDAKSEGHQEAGEKNAIGGSEYGGADGLCGLGCLGSNSSILE